MGKDLKVEVERERERERTVESFQVRLLLLVRVSGDVGRSVIWLFGSKRVEI
jgi:hypothetical protein